MGSRSGKFDHATDLGDLYDRSDPAPLDHWTVREVDEAAFKDIRLGRRFGQLLRQVGDGMGESIPFACQDWANTKAAYRFFANDRVEEGEILSGHFAATRARYDACKGTSRLLKFSPADTRADTR